MPFFVYILQSDKDGSFWRLLEHNCGMSKYTSKKSPWKIVYTEELDSRTEALKREVFLKRQRNREFYFRLIALHNRNYS